MRSRRLLLLRHAKSSWAEPLPDRERPLAPRGRRAAPAMAAYMRGEGLVPDAVLCSPAVRTRQTWSLAAPILGDPPVEYREALYHGGIHEMTALVSGVTEDVALLLVIGHNPGLHELALTLAGDGDAVSRDRLSAKLPTCALAVLEFGPGGWDRLQPGAGTLVRYVRPKDLPEAGRLRL